ncbi:hypothetical protein ABD87_22770 [Lysinibacillus sphaericus]|uniref:hypothetical protein n=1 Tax=Lysinibacillus sphaericus TaxID=1421 RepID=UPI0018CF0C9C|nr:hypothetical protein [Lysinibacillus sphaericus]MBG9732251.1 hypothetical protein [Lysinibacillus sphaericus]
MGIINTNDTLRLTLNCEEIYDKTIIEYDYATSVGKDFSLEATAYSGENDDHFAIMNIPIEYFERSGLPRHKACKVVAKMLSHSWHNFIKMQGNRKLSIQSLMKLFFSNIGLSEVRIVDVTTFRDEQHVGGTTLFYCTHTQMFNSLDEMVKKLPMDCCKKNAIPFYMYRGNGFISLDIRHYTVFNTIQDNTTYVFVKAKTITCHLIKKNVKYRNFFEKTILSRPYLLIQMDQEENLIKNGISKRLITSKPRTVHFFKTENEVLNFAKDKGVKGILTSYK